jgi:hypothetical protein
MQLSVLFFFAAALLVTAGASRLVDFSLRGSAQRQHLRSMTSTWPKDLSKLIFPGDSQSVTFSGSANWTTTGVNNNASQLNVPVTGRFDIEAHHKKIAENYHELGLVQVDGSAFSEEVWVFTELAAKNVVQYENYFQPLQNTSDPDRRCYHSVSNTTTSYPNQNLTVTGYVQGKDTKVSGVKVNVFTSGSVSTTEMGFDFYFLETWYLHKGSIVMYERNQTDITGAVMGGQRTETLVRVKVTKSSKLDPSAFNVSALCMNPPASPTAD